MQTHLKNCLFIGLMVCCISCKKKERNATPQDLVGRYQMNYAIKINGRIIPASLKDEGMGTLTAAMSGDTALSLHIVMEDNDVLGGQIPQLVDDIYEINAIVSEIVGTPNQVTSYSMTSHPATLRTEKLLRTTFTLEEASFSAINHLNSTFKAKISLSKPQAKMIFSALSVAIDAFPAERINLNLEVILSNTRKTEA